jgi:hypothetical protein
LFRNRSTTPVWPAAAPPEGAAAVTASCDDPHQVFGLPLTVYVLPPADREADDLGAGVDGAELAAVLDAELAAEPDVVDAELDGAADDCDWDDDCGAPAVDAAPTPVPCQGEDELHALRASTARVIATVDRRCTGTLPSRRRRRRYPTNAAKSGRPLSSGHDFAVVRCH